jgi:hypothetical protein
MQSNDATVPYSPPLQKKIFFFEGLLFGGGLQRLWDSPNVFHMRLELLWQCTATA